jgi:hypothetical protein
LSKREYSSVVEGDKTIQNLFNDHYDAGMSLEPDSEAARYERALMDGVLGKIRDLANSHRVPLALVIIPAAVDVADRFPVQIDAAKYPRYFRSTLTDAVEGIAARRGIPYINLWTPMRETDASRFYFHFDDHWSPEGNAFAAERVADFLDTSGLVGSGGARHR